MRGPSEDPLRQGWLKRRAHRAEQRRRASRTSSPRPQRDIRETASLISKLRLSRAMLQAVFGPAAHHCSTTLRTRSCRCCRCIVDECWRNGPPHSSAKCSCPFESSHAERVWHCVISRGKAMRSNAKQCGSMIEDIISSTRWRDPQVTPPQVIRAALFSSAVAE